jgi:hypothetical protein
MLDRDEWDDDGRLQRPTPRPCTCLASYDGAKCEACDAAEEEEELDELEDFEELDFEHGR